jgi:hypothetical protein
MNASSGTVCEYAKRLNGLKVMIGNTPLVGIHFTFRGRWRVRGWFSLGD